MQNIKGEFAVYLVCAIFIVLILYFFIICPRIFYKPDMAPFCIKPIAHRGMFDNISVTENSLEAFRRACDSGFGIELDVRLSSDGIPVVIHDDNLERVTGFFGRVREMTLSEIKSHPLNQNGDTVPTFDEAVREIRGRVPLLIEMKGTNAAIAEEVYNIMKNYEGVYAVESFDPRHIRRYSKLSPQTARGVLVNPHSEGDKVLEKAFAYLSERMVFNFYTRPDFVAMKQSSFVKNFPVRLCSLLGIKKIVWTVRTVEELDAAGKACDGFICENLDDLTNSKAC